MNFKLALLSILSLYVFSSYSYNKDTTIKIATEDFSTAGFYELEKSGREVFNFNTGWRFSKDPDSNFSEVYNKDFDDSKWEKVSIPHGLEFLPEEASGDRNYQGKAWYRKKFTIDESLKSKKIFLHFEAIMGKSKIWINGELVKENYGGYLPVIIEVQNKLEIYKENIIVVLTDNSNDPLFAPGKPQQIMDFTYMGGIYRDCYMITHNDMYITDPNFEDETAGGGLCVWTSALNKKEATLNFKTHIRNSSAKDKNGYLSFRIIDEQGNVKTSSKVPYSLKSGESDHVFKDIKVKDPNVWSPEDPNLYCVEIRVFNDKNKIVDGYIKKIGIKTAEFRGTDGFWLNGEPYQYKLMGVNRHQDFAIIGNAMPNSLHYRDVKKLKEAGVRLIRSAHYPQDPAFMDACDKLGIFVIVATPGWQFWNNDPIFEKRVLSDIRNMVRRDRNHPSVFLWEPILNETHFPEEFSLNAMKTVESEWPFTPIYSAADPSSAGSKYFPVIYTAPNAKNSLYHISSDKMDKNKVYLTREWGDNVDDWSSNNSPSRVHRTWGENAMLIQAEHYSDPSKKYEFTCYETFFNTNRQHLGGTIWCGFDHFRGYHPQNFFGGLMDSYRQPKYSYYWYMAQRPVANNPKIEAETGPMIFIAHELSPFSSSDVVVYSNCEEVKLTVFEDGKSYTYKRDNDSRKMPSPIIVFEDVFHYMELKSLARGNKRDKIYLLAEGIIDGKVVTTHKVRSALKPTQLRLRIDSESDLVADGSDIAIIIAELIDNEGNIKRLNNDYVKFSIDGPARIIESNPSGLRKLDWGTAPVLIQSTSEAGRITVKAELEVTGISTAKPVELIFESIPSTQKSIAKKSELISKYEIINSIRKSIEYSDEQRKQLDKELEKVHAQQSEFGDL